MEHRAPISHRLLTITTCIILISLAWHVRTIKNTWTYAKGYEQEWVAGSVLSGHGFSFDPATAWLGPYSQADAFTPTAWVEPLYTFIIAAGFIVFGEYGRLFLVLLNVVWLGASGVMIFLLVRDFTNPHAGLYTALLFLLVHTHRFEVILYIGNAALAGFIYCLIAYLLIRCTRNPTLLSGAVLGGVIGLANLNHAGSLLFAPLSALIIFLANARSWAKVWQTCFLLMLTAVLILTPWVLRNYHTFGAFVPVRSGFGYQLYIGNPGLAGTFTPGMDDDAMGTKPPWVASGPLHALRLLRNLEYDAALASHSIQFVSNSGIPGYQEFNEVQRDRIFLSRSLDFLRVKPVLALQMAFWKTITFLTFWNPGLGLLSLTAFLGSLLYIKDVRIAGISFLVVVYMLPYVTSLPLYYRYRSPIEPLFFTLAGLFLDASLQKTKSVWLFLTKYYGHKSGNAIGSVK
jgi:hypothetical protein